MTRTIEGLEIKIGDNFLAWSVTCKLCSLSLLKIFSKLKYLNFKAHMLTWENSAHFPAVAPKGYKIAKSANTDVPLAAVATLDTPDGTLNAHQNLEKLILTWGILHVIAASITAIKTTTVGLFPLLCTPFYRLFVQKWIPDVFFQHVIAKQITRNINGWKVIWKGESF